MRFSSIFQMPLTERAAAVPPAPAPARVEEPVAPIAVAAAPPVSGELPEALDERVRLVGEWQLGV